MKTNKKKLKKIKSRKLKQNLVKWLINIHNEVNIINGKKQLSYEEVVRHYFGSKKKSYRINKK